MNKIEDNNEADPWMKSFCNNHCKVAENRDETFFTKEEILKIRQKRPQIQQKYRMKPRTITPS
jgi:hypothetical protein